MISVRKFWNCVIIWCMLLLGSVSYAESSKELSRNAPTYKVNSECLNFNYANMSYPFDSPKLGFKTDKDKIKLVERRENKNEEATDDVSIAEKCLDSIIETLFMLMLTALSIVAVLLVACFFEYLITILYEKEKNED